ncbi:hypothetical protein DI09_121p80 [Mitosporidium daphniae]|uniref:Uncharacterized protein n=1 Tax=Mitosporidium daphniae TaxID=1485682 RepID=A0A098VVS9_9MICR|nr:uncharacterized protein DI09_121p80 [Mitosporidium daphniae]KGG52949.1 hypothetical protein DI09_121p80 [Mitosporidium daphniae]|eukprot:XP_013239385.1 uncharacterized protein DI09_121p80 [Mitosporidium daphniae]
MHTSVSTHLSYKYFNESSGLFEPNIFEYQHRVGLYPERKANFFLTFVVLFRAIQKISPIIHSNYDFRLKESPDDEQKTKDIFQKISKLSLKCPNLFNEKLLFNTKSNPDALLLKQSLRDHFQNISRILDCVGCQRCRLWGKIQIIGLGTALKILFSYPEDITKCSLSRVELVALYNTLGKYSETLFFIQRLDSLVAESGVSGEKTEAPTSWNDVAFSCLLAFIFALLLLVFCSCLYIRYRKGAIKACSLSCSSESAENSIYALNENSPLKTHGSTGRLQKRLNRSTGSLFEEEEE